MRLPLPPPVSATRHSLTTLAVLLIAACTPEPPDHTAPGTGALTATTSPAGLANDTPTAPSALRDVLRAATFVGEVEVTEVHGRRGTMGTQHAEAIWSDVTVTPLAVLLDRDGLTGDGTHPFALTFLGGATDGRVMHVADGPRLAVGDRVILIADHRQTPWPTWGGAAGVLRVDASDQVRSHDGRPIVAVDAEGIRAGAMTSPTRHVAPAPRPRSPGASSRVLDGALGDPMTRNDVLEALARLLETVR